MCRRINLRIDYIYGFCTVHGGWEFSYTHGHGTSSWISTKAPVGAAPTTSTFLTLHLASMDWESQLQDETRFDGIPNPSLCKS